MLKCSVGGHALFRVDGQTLFDKVTSGMRDVSPIFDRCERVVGLQDGLHFFQIRISVERSITAEEEVRDNADSPDVTVVKLNPAQMKGT